MQIALPPLREHAGGRPAARRATTSMCSTASSARTIRGVTPEAMELLQALPLAGQHPRAAQRRRARDAARRRRLADAGSTAGGRGPPRPPRRPMELPDEGVNLETARARARRAGAPADGLATRRKAAALLGLNRDQIRYRIEKFGLEKTADRRRRRIYPPARREYSPPSGRATARAARNPAEILSKSASSPWHTSCSDGYSVRSTRTWFLRDRD